eukprot:903800-Prorocentrum_minimum.AAC.1
MVHWRPFMVHRRPLTVHWRPETSAERVVFFVSFAAVEAAEASRTVREKTLAENSIDFDLEDIEAEIAKAQAIEKSLLFSEDQLNKEEKDASSPTYRDSN